MFTKDDIHTLVDVVLVDPTRVDLFPWSCATQRFVVLDVAQTKKQCYCDWHLVDQFLLLAVDVFECLHKYANVFLHKCANAIWSLKGLEGLVLSILVSFFYQKNSITLQRLQASSILSRAIAVGLATSLLPPFFNTFAISTTDLLQAFNFCYGKIQSTYY
jgi:hypothetical protein